MAFDIARVEPPVVGTVIAHPEDPISYYIREIKGDVAVCCYDDENGQEVVKEYPLKEIFNVNVARVFAMELRLQELVNGIDERRVVAPNN